MTRALARWGVVALVVVAAFFGTWLLCQLVFPGLGLDVVLSLSGLTTAVASLPLGVWAGRDRLPVASPRAQVVVGEIPRQPPAFQPRADLRAQLTGAKGVAVVSAVTGSRGIGKTHLAAAVARACIEDGWPLVAWIVAEDAAQALAGMERLARALELTARDDDAVTAARKARSWLETEAGPRSLVVFDNVPDSATVRPWLPAVGSTRIIVTSTSQACEDLGTPVRVDAFTLTEAVSFLSERTGLADEAGAQALAGEVGCLPLALGQAAAVIRTQRLTYEDVLDRIRTMPLDRLLMRAHGDYPHGAAQAVLLAVESVERNDPLAATVTGLVAILSPAGIRREILRAYADVDATVGRLVEASVLTFSIDGTAVLMHRFTQLVLRERAQRTGDLPSLILLAAQLVSKCLPRQDSHWEHRVFVRDLIPQIDTLWALVERGTADGTVTEAIREILLLRRWSVEILWLFGDSPSALRRGPSVVADHERLLGEVEETTVARYCLALAHGLQGQHDEAIRLNKQVGDWYADNRGPEDLTTLGCRMILGNNYTESAHDFGEPARLATAIAVYEQALGSVEHAAEPGSPLALLLSCNLSRAYREAGRIAEAISVAEECWARGKRVRGPAYRHTLWAGMRLAEAYAAAGQLAEALRLVAEIMPIVESALDTDYPARWSHEISRLSILRKGGYVASTIGELEKIAADNVKVLGENRTTTRHALEELARAYVDIGDLRRARDTYARVYDICLYLVGADSLLTRRVVRELAQLQGKRTPLAVRVRGLVRRRSVL